MTTFSKLRPRRVARLKFSNLRSWQKAGRLHLVDIDLEKDLLLLPSPSKMMNGQRPHGESDGAAV
jgi:hypothetical protein